MAMLCVVEDVADLWAMERAECRSRGAIMCWVAPLSALDAHRPR